MSQALEFIIGDFKLAEGPMWMKNSNTLIFIDIFGHSINILDKDEKCKTIKLPDMPGCVVPMENGNILVAVKDTLFEVCLSSQSIVPYLKIHQEDWLRFNDGKCDEDGRLWLGSMACDQNHTKAIGGGMFYCIEAGTIKLSDPGYTIPNGIDFLSKTSFYHADSHTGYISLCHMKNNMLTKKPIFKIPTTKGVPDGFCLDLNGNLWIALWGGYSVICVSPKTGELLYEIALPDKNVTCCCFGGNDMDYLYITTAQDELHNGGNLYKIKTSVKGRAPFCYNQTSN